MTEFIEGMGGADPKDLVRYEDHLDLRGEKLPVGPGTKNGPKDQPESESLRRDLRRQEGIAELL